MLNKMVTAGFDGYIDRIYKAIEKGDRYFTNIYEFGNYIASKHPRSCAVQMDLISERMGGNAPLFVNTLRRLVSEVNLIGMLGKDIINPIFNTLPSNGKNISFSDPAETIAIEYTDSKLFLSPRLLKPHNLESFLDEVKFKEMLNTSDLAAFLNWGEIDFMMDIWEYCWKSIVSNNTVDFNKYFFFDLADFSRHSEERINSLLALIKEYSSKRRVILGLNGNECSLLARSIDAKGDMKAQIRAIHSITNAIVVTHTREISVAFDGTSFFEKAVRIIEEPLIATGIGDNFNAGFCYGLLLGVSIDMCLEYGNSSANKYLKTGHPSASQEELEETRKLLYP